jgi:Fe-S oxidoreductase
MSEGMKAGVSTAEMLTLGNTGDGWVARDKEGWKDGGSADYYNWMSGCRRLLLTKDELTFLEKQTVPDRKVDVFVNMSCGTQLIPNVNLDIVGVFRALGVNFVAGTGVQFCCGKPFRTHDQQPAGERVSQSSLDRFRDWGATTAVHACQSCQIIYENFTTERKNAAPGLSNQHLTWFLENRLRELGDRVPWKRELNMRVLLTGCHAVTPVHRESIASVARLLALIPGVEVVGSIESTSRGAPCTTPYPGGPSILAELSDDEQAAVMRELEETACNKYGAEVIVMDKHWCQREWAKFATDRLSVRHFMSVAAEALGCQNPDRYGEYWKLHAPERVVDLSRSCWTSWGLDEQEARRIAYKHFDPHYSGFINAECACGGDPAKCSTGKFTLARSGSDEDTGATGPRSEERSK